MMRALARPIWNRRHGIILGAKKAMSRALRLGRRLPIPQTVRLAMLDVFFLSIEQLILNTNLHRSWQAKRSGTERLHRLMKPEKQASFIPAPLPSAPTIGMFQELPDHCRRAGPIMNGALIDVILPVYKSYEQTLNAIYACLATPNVTPFELIVINDASPDAQLTAALRQLAEMRCFTLVENPENLGFVQTVNKGMQTHAERDVILLNSDTEVYNDWLDRLYAHGMKSNAIGTVTPFSNNAEICSYPHFITDNNMALEIDFATLDSLARTVNAGMACELPTGVGFCMYIKRRCLKHVGLFDADTFGKGYGEENDFCLRAMKNGWKHLLAGDIFVRHFGGTSFSERKNALVAKGLKKLNARYPHYRGLVRDFIRDDPAYPMRQRLDLARLRHAGRQMNMLMVNHSRGGGTEKQVHDLSAALEAEGIGAFQLKPSADGIGIELSHYRTPHVPNLQFSMEYDRQAFFEAMLELGIAHLHIHHLIGFPQRIMDFLTELCGELGIGYDVTLHDYYTIDPRINLIDENDFYSGEPDIETQERLIERSGTQSYGMPVWQWRLVHGRFLRAARAVFVPDDDVALRMQRYLPDVSFLVRPHPESFDDGTMLCRAGPRLDEELKVVVLGGLSPIKGSRVVAALAEDALARELPIRYVLIGHTNHASLNAGLANVTITGEYRDDEIEGLLAQHAPHLILIPSVWPETYSYTLSIALRHGIHPVVFDLGAPARRLRELDFGSIVELDKAHDAEWLNNFLLSIEPAEHQIRRPANVGYANYLRDYYELASSRHSFIAGAKENAA